VDRLFFISEAKLNYPSYPLQSTNFQQDVIHHNNDKIGFFNSLLINYNVDKFMKRFLKIFVSPIWIKCVFFTLKKGMMKNKSGY
jgi:hypothetical protein